MNNKESIQKLVCLNPYQQDHIDKMLEFETHLVKNEQPLVLSTILKMELKDLTREDYQEKKQGKPLKENFFLEEMNHFKASCYVEENPIKESVEVYIFVPMSYRRNHYATNLLKMVEQYVFFHYPKMKGIIANVNLDNHQALNLFSQLGYELSSTDELSAIFYQANKKLIHDKDVKAK